jgi:hypothetical protein
VFTTAHPRVGTPQGESAHRDTIGTRARRIAAAATALAFGAGFALAAPLSASAEERPSSYAAGQFLSGTILGVDLDQVVDVTGAEARNDGTQSTQTTKDPLDASVLEEAVVVEEAEAPQFDLGGVLQIGPVAQYAQANGDGSSLGASGAVADDGAIGVGSDRSTPPANATFDLAALLGPEFASTLVDLKLELGAIAASAQGDLDAASGDYQLGHAVLTFSSPAISDLTPKVDAALQEVVDALNQLVGPGGSLVDEVNGMLVNLDPVLNLLGGSGNVTATINTGDLTEAVHSLLEEQYGNGAVSFSLETGEVRVDLEQLLGGDLNDLAPGTELLTDEVVNQILEGITTTVSTIADQVVDKVEDVLHDAKVDIHADLSVNVAQAPLVQEVCRLVDRVLTTPVLTTLTASDLRGLLQENGVGGLLGTLLNGLGLGELTDRVLDLGIVGSLTDGVTDNVGDVVLVDGVLKEITGFVNQTVQDNVCSSTSTALAPLTTSVVLDIEATIDELLNGAAAKAVADVDILGIDTNLRLDGVLGDLGGTLLDGLFDGDGGVQELGDSLEQNLVHPATEVLLGTSGEGGLLGLGSVGDALRDIVSVKVNIQELRLVADGGMAAMAGSMFTQTAVRVSVLGDSVATVNLAQATVGPNITRIVDCVDPNGCDTGGETETPGGGGPGGGSLAYTGIGIATLIAVILALLAAGAYLVRESYRRNQAVVSTLE